MTTDDMKIVTLHSWTPGEVCPGGIHEFVRREYDYFVKRLEMCKHCAAVRHYQWWDFDVELVETGSSCPNVYSLPDNTVQFYFHERAAVM